MTARTRPPPPLLCILSSLSSSAGYCHSPSNPHTHTQTQTHEHKHVHTHSLSLLPSSSTNLPPSYDIFLTRHALHCEDPLRHLACCAVSPSSETHHRARSPAETPSHIMPGSQPFLSYQPQLRLSFSLVACSANRPVRHEQRVDLGFDLLKPTGSTGSARQRAELGDLKGPQLLAERRLQATDMCCGLSVSAASASGCTEHTSANGDAGVSSPRRC